MKFHQLADIFPLMAEDELKTLANDIAANGLNEPIRTYEGKVLDGRNRFKACQLAKVEPRFEEYSGDKPLVYILSENLTRRHLDASQRSMLSAKVADLRVGDNQYQKKASSNELSISQAEAATACHVSVASLKRAKSVLDSGNKVLISEVESGKKTVAKAAAELKQKEKAKAHHAVTTFNGKYRVFYADPPWKYNDKCEGGGVQKGGGAERHYPCMSIQELCDFKDADGRTVRDVTTKDAVLFLWVTSPMLAECFPVIEAWGFTYKASFVWDKAAHNMGHYNSVQHELLLVCTKGSCVPDGKTLEPSIVKVTKSEKHSQKPEAFRDMIDRMYVRPKQLAENENDRIELFSREDRNGWDVFGNEIS